MRRAAGLQLPGGYHLVRECDRAEVRRVELQEGWVTITVRGRDEPFLKKKPGPRRVRRLRRALERYDWLERENGSAAN